MTLNPNTFVDGAMGGFSLHIEPPSYTYLLETGHALDDLRCGPCSVPRSLLEHILILSTS